MGTTLVPGITRNADGRFIIDKRDRGIRIGMRVRAVSMEEAQKRLQRRKTANWSPCTAATSALPSGR